MVKGEVTTFIWRKWTGAPDDYVMLITKVDEVFAGILFDGRDARVNHTQYQLEALAMDPHMRRWWDVYS